MSQKQIEGTVQKGRSLDNLQIRQSQHSKNKRNLAEQLRLEMCQLIKKRNQAKIEMEECYQLYEVFKLRKDEAEADFQYKSYRIWVGQLHRLGQAITVRLKAVQKYERPKKIMETKTAIDNKMLQMKYGPSDDEN